MILDARSLPKDKTIKTDICIVGAGLAGITLAREFINSEFRVCILESGGLQPDKATQSLYWGENTGFPYYALDTARARLFGGSSHRWRIGLGNKSLGVRLRPLDKLDFEERECIPYSGWPFDKTHLDSFYERAQAVFRAGPFRYDVDYWEDPAHAPQLRLTSDELKTVMFQFGVRDLFFKDYRDEIDHAENISVYLYGNVVDIETTSNAQSVTRLRVACLNGVKFWVSAEIYVLAVGGIENARLLLMSDKVLNNGLGNQNDLVGRFFMEHIHLSSGFYIPSLRNIFESTRLYAIHKTDGIPVMGKLALSEASLKREGIPNYCVSLHPTLCPNPNVDGSCSKGINSVRKLRDAVLGGYMPNSFSREVSNILGDLNGIARYAYHRIGSRGNIGAFRLNHMTEQVPNPESRVTLSEELDALGCRRGRLNWKLSHLDIRGIVRAQEIIDTELRLSGLGKLHIQLKDETLPKGIHGGWHHMGTTRMHRNPKEGVVDEQCRVHNIANLFIAGSSVFPTCGYANPNLTIVALVLRLADHMKAIMRRQ